MNTKTFIFLFLLFNFCSCDKLDTRELLVRNNSDKVIFSIFSDNDNMNNAGFYYEYQDGFDESKRGDYDAPFIFTEIKKGQTVANYDTPRYWDTFFNTLEDKKARLFIVQKDSVDKYGWKEIFKKNIYNKKYLFTIKDLDSLNWTITYDGNPRSPKSSL
ncbi:hypothetical protein GON26_12535 [Flavobacterium sp. GA093]|uniref:Uncharacterized protein n=1 Tax=Flavobacterium hydrocarbonoxydans TaxID=2683249 RepID=A0A6I4NLF3_9FLAO|nr:hypothetical protein [Flavobacterium hydrocarbonoxydans]MWB95190.1 hypothetical protein [Flavobacterium hydrocarbonoxydans]